MCARCYQNRGGCYFNRQQHDAAIKDLQKAIELEPKNGVYYSSLGWYQLFNRKPRESIAASLKALELSPDNAVMIKGNLAHGYLFDNQFERRKQSIWKTKMPSSTMDGPLAKPCWMTSKSFRRRGLLILIWRKSKRS